MVEQLVSIGNAIFDAMSYFGALLTTPIAELMQLNGIYVPDFVLDWFGDLTLFSFSLTAGIGVFIVVTVVGWVLKAIPLV